MNPRQRRIAADWDALRAEYSGHEAVTIEPVGPLPPEEYEVVLRVPGLRRDGERPIVVDEHKVRIQLPLGYPRDEPYCTPLTAVFHPNISERICIGDYWAAGEQLVDIVARISEMIQYRLYNPASPLDAVAAKYAIDNRELFPIGDIEIYSPEIEVRRTDEFSDTDR
jgi:Ubiquitin-conjugating enzyme